MFGLPEEQAVYRLQYALQPLKIYLPVTQLVLAQPG